MPKPNGVKAIGQQVKFFNQRMGNPAADPPRGNDHCR